MIGAENAAGGRQLGTKLEEVIDLPVEDDPNTAICGPHRLHAALDVEDAQAAVAEEGALGLVDPEALGVGAAVDERTRHGLQRRRVACANEPSKPAHAC